MLNNHVRQTPNRFEPSRTRLSNLVIMEDPADVGFSIGMKIWKALVARFLSTSCKLNSNIHTKFYTVEKLDKFRPGDRSTRQPGERVSGRTSLGSFTRQFRPPISPTNFARQFYPLVLPASFACQFRPPPTSLTRQFRPAVSPAKFARQFHPAPGSFTR